MTEMGDGRVGKVEKIADDDKKQIDHYLKQVEKNLKGFTQEAKNSIIIEIREHILDRVHEEQETDKKKDENTLEDQKDQSPMVDQGSVTKVLKEFGDPETVALGYVPILRATSRKLIAFQTYSVILSISIIGMIFREFSHNPVINWDFSENMGPVIGFIGFLTALFTIGHTIEYHRQGIRLARYSFFTIVANGIFGVTLISYLLYHIEISSEVFLPDSIFLVLAILPFWVSYQGFMLMTRDTADGISPLNTISGKLFPLILLIDLIVLFQVLDEISSSFDQILLWNTMAAYILTFVLLLVLTSNGLAVVVKWKFPVKIRLIEKELFALCMSSLIIISSIFTGVTYDRNDLTRSIDHEDYIGSYDSEALSTHAHAFLSYQETPYTWAISSSDDRYIFSLDRWNEDLTSRTRAQDIPIPVDSKEYKMWFRSVESSGRYIHALATLEKPSDDWRNEEREDHYFLLTFDGKLVGHSLLPADDMYGSIESFTFRNNTAQLYFYEENFTQEEIQDPNVTGSYKKIHSINISRFILLDGQIEGQPINYSISLTPLNLSWDQHPRRVKVFPGQESFTLLLEFTDHIEYVVNDQHRIDYRAYSYGTTIHLNGTVLVPWIQVQNDTPTPCYISPEDEVCIRGYEFHGYQQMILFRNYYELNNNSMWNYQLVYLEEDGISDSLIYTEQYSNTVRITNWIAVTDENGMTCLPIFTRTENDSSLMIGLSNVFITPNGSISLTENFTLRNVSIFDFMVDRFNDERYEDLAYSIWPTMITHDGNTTYLFFDVWVHEETFLYEKDGIRTYERIHSVYQLNVLKISNGTISSVSSGPEIDERETKDEYHRTQMFGILGGGGISLVLVGLIKKRGKGGG